MNRIIFVTGNANKLKEVEAILKLGFSSLEITSLSLDLPEIQNDDPVEIVKDKCKAAVSITGKPTLVEDTCLCFNAYGGLPGPFIKWFLKKLGPEGLHKMLNGFEDKSAEAHCYFAFSNGKLDDEIQVFKGITPGTIVQPRGGSGFGWDSCFQPDGFDVTYAEMSKELKNSISHRGRALDNLKQYFSNYTETSP